MKQLSAEDKDLSESQELNHLRIHLNQEILKNQDLIGELNTLQKENVDLKFKLRQLQPGRSLSDELSRESTKADRFTQTEISYDRSGCNQEGIHEEELLDEGYCNSFEQEWLEIDESLDSEYELIKQEHLSQISCNDRLEILRKRGCSESEIDEICSQGDSWYTLMNIPMLENKVQPSSMDSRDSLRKQVCVWFAQEHDLSESQEKLNKKLLNIVKYLDWYDESALFYYDNGSVHQLEKFLEDNKSNPDLKVVLNLERGESGATVLHAVLGARIYEVGHNQENRADVGLLLAAGADPNAENYEGETPLHYAAAIGNSKGVSSLLRGGANPNICDKQGKTPQQVAIDNGHYDMVKLLLTKEQEELCRELYNILVMTISAPIRFTKPLKEFLDKHKSNPNLKVVLNLQSERGKSEVLEFAEHISCGAEIRDLLFEAEASDNVCHRIVEKKLSCVLWRNLMPDQQKKLDDFLDRVSKAEDMETLEKVVNEAIRSGVRLNFNKDFSPEDPIACNWCSLTDYTIKRIGELNKSKRNSKVASGIVCNLVSAGAIFYIRNSIDVIDKLELEFECHKADIVRAYASYINDTSKLIEVTRSATNGRLNDVRMDNAVFYCEYSEDSTIDIAMITDKARDLELNQKKVGYRRNIIKIGKSEVDIITENGIRNYTNLADNSDIVLTFYTSQGELEVRLYHDKQNKGQIKVEVKNQDLLESLKNCKEELGKNCLLGGLLVNEAIKQGFFFRSRLNQPSETLSVNSSLGDVSLSSPIQGSIQQVI